jgi:hypothetical protein
MVQRFDRRYSALVVFKLYERSTLALPRGLCVCVCVCPLAYARTPLYMRVRCNRIGARNM